MKGHLLNGGAKNRSPWVFFLLVFLLSIPFWVVGPLAERLLPGELPIDLPISSLMIFAPVSAAVVLVRRKEGPDAPKRLLKRALDYKRIKKKAWYVPILFFWPAVMVLQYGLMKLMAVSLPDPQIPVLMVLVSSVLFFIAALGEEVGWQGYAIGPLRDRWNALTASIILGIVWAAWHIVPLIQATRPPAWIVWQCMGMVATRILIVWLYNNTGKSVFAAILFHAMNNVTTVLLPNYGWHYEPFVALITLAIAAAIVIFLWSPETLARYRYARPGRYVQSSVAN
jgi:membrane protease YdiL (CAAX protease family)